MIWKHTQVAPQRVGGRIFKSYDTFLKLHPSCMQLV